MNWTWEIGASILVVVVYGALFIGVEAWSRRKNPPVELTRKTVHLGGGLIAATFPWLFQSQWTPAILAVPFVVLLLVVRHAGMLRSVQGVERSSIGEILYPIAIAATMILSSGIDNPAIYLAAILTLAISDASAGLLGSIIGKRKYRTIGGTKSLEGSLIFLGTSLLIMGSILLLKEGWYPGATLTAVLLASIGATIAEALSPKGFDNLVIPLVVLFVLQQYISITV
jgi:dolichol kinase